MENIGQQHMLILFATVFALLALIEAFHRAYGVPEVYEQAEKLLKSLNEIPYFKE